MSFKPQCSDLCGTSPYLLFSPKSKIKRTKPSVVDKIDLNVEIRERQKAIGNLSSKQGAQWKYRRSEAATERKEKDIVRQKIACLFPILRTKYLSARSALSEV